MSMKIKYNFHSHTYRCGHAAGTDEEYVQHAIKAGFKEIGFSDHIFLPGVIQRQVRGPYEMIEDYLKSVNELKEKYKDQIKIRIGFEAEYAEHFLPYYRELLESGKVEYLIQGQHCYFDEDKPDWYNFFLKKPKLLNRYVDDVINGMKSGLFKYLCHPDLFVMGFQRDCKTIDTLSAKICEASLKYDIPLEINMCRTRDTDYGHKDNLCYPFDHFWRIAGQYQCKVVVGVDAHHPSHYDLDKTDYDLPFRLAKKYNLNLITDYKID